MLSSDFRQRARDALSGNWFVAVIAGLIASLVGAISSGGSVDFDFSGEDMEYAELEQVFSMLGIKKELLAAVLGFAGLLAVFSLIYMLVSMIVGSAVSVGYAQFNLDLVDGASPSVGTLFSRFGQWKNALAARLISGLIVFLWSLLFVIPGIIASYNYVILPYVMADEPNLSPGEALAQSKRLMKGNRWRFFCLEMSFIGWAILSLLTFGIGSLFLLPYTQASHAAFYREIKRERDCGL